jgi:hypothetical protein
MTSTQPGARGASGTPERGLRAPAVADYNDLDESGEVEEKSMELDEPDPGENTRTVGDDTTGDDGVDELFAEFVDELPVTAGTAREEYLPRRGYVPVRQLFVQHRQGERPSTLGDMVGKREFRPLVLYLLLLACETLLAHNRWLPLRTVANMLTTSNYPCSVRQARQAIDVLKRRDLVRVVERGTSVELYPLLEDGSGAAWTPPMGQDEAPDLKPYMAVPHALFSDAVLDRLHLPGLAMLLVALKETNAKSVFSVSVERFEEWYGFSERTAERGYRELADAGLMRVHRQLVRDSRMPRGVKSVYHRALLGPFGTQARRDAQRRAQENRRATGAKATAS